MNYDQSTRRMHMGGGRLHDYVSMMMYVDINVDHQRTCIGARAIDGAATIMFPPHGGARGL